MIKCVDCGCRITRRRGRCKPCRIRKANESRIKRGKKQLDAAEAGGTEVRDGQVFQVMHLPDGKKGGRL